MITRVESNNNKINFCALKPPALGNKVQKMLTRAENFSSEIKPELENIIRFKKIIDEYVYGKPKGIKIVMLEDLSKDLEYVLEKMQK